MASIEKSLLFATKAKKKISLQAISQYVSNFKNSKNKLSLHQKYALLPSIAHLFYLFTLNFNAQTQKFRNMFYCVQGQKAERTKEKNRLSYGQRKKNKQQIEEGNNQISMQQILDETISGDKNIVNVLPILQTIRKEPIMDNQTDDVTIEPFDPNIIEQMSQQMLSNFKLKNGSTPNLQNIKLEEYKKWLQISQKGTFVQPTSRKKRFQTIKKQGKVKATLDQLIQIGQEPINRSQQIFLLVTKAKNSYKKSIGSISYISYQMNRLNSLLTLNQGLQNLKLQIIRKKQKLSSEKARNLVENNYIFENNQFENYLSRSKEKFNHQKNIFFVIQNNDPTITKRLQEKIKYLIDEKLAHTYQISFNDFCLERNISKQVKGELFYQFLNLDYTLRQKNVQHFSDIKISMAAIQ